MKKVSTWLLVCWLAAACSQKPEPINYGHDGCHYCKMTIMDNRYGAEIVTEKFKVLKFDAVECMLNYQKAAEANHDNSLLLVTDFQNPGKLIDATAAYYLRSASLPSPMGMYLTSFASHQAVMQTMDQHSGDKYSWQDLTKEFPNFPTLNDGGQ
ncbi:nitrous oxide reductase accessory protein NosL [Fulvivirgaceae bacterium BMA12]|uniref:Nitrous oxide reductase accessory protein NosL n=1 Tax=Agaribacillus aureus TaxID=3051825 RepID=A0ABT8L1B3_9BACT|nr:nitrous oxide reductase accessory protein NosL [Fulvivirgaceae bacterium BMA12]